MSVTNIQIHINGEPKLFESPLSVAELICKLFPDFHFYAVALNHSILPRSEHARTFLKAGDRIEIVQPVGGG
jgi:sulfur carrier protein